MIRISDNCIGCSKCVKACPFGALYMEGKMAMVNDKCTLCGACVTECPVNAITLTKKVTDVKDLSGYKGVWVFTEVTPLKKGQEIRGVTFELLSAAKKLAADLGEEVSAVLIGHDVKGMADTLASYGAATVYVVDSKDAQDYNTDVYSHIMTTLIKKHKPSVVLYPSTYVGRDLAPRIAGELYVGLTADCTGLSIKEGNLLQSRPAFGGNIMADILAPTSRPQMATVRPNVMKKDEPVKGAKAKVVAETVKLNPKHNRVKLVERKFTAVEGVEKIDEAQIIVSGGRGMKDKSGFKELSVLADCLGGAVGASRAAVDMGLLHKTHQVGQSGTTVSPKVYIACGISGAVQHIVGMSGSDRVIAINKDDKASIFNNANYGLVGDAKQIVAKVNEKLKGSKKK